MAACTRALDMTRPRDANTSSICASVQREAFADACLGLFMACIHRALYDMAAPQHNPFPAPHLHGYLTEASVLARPWPSTLQLHGRLVGGKHGLRPHLRHGAHRNGRGRRWRQRQGPHLVYGDRDLIANWRGGERASLAVPHPRGFRGTGG